MCQCHKTCCQHTVLYLSLTPSAISSGVNFNISLGTTNRNGSVLVPANGEEKATLRGDTKRPAVLIHTTDLLRSTPIQMSAVLILILVWIMMFRIEFSKRNVIRGRCYKRDRRVLQEAKMEIVIKIKTEKN